MPNSRFTELLAASPLSSEERYNLEVIFDVLRDERKIDIIDHWDKYLEQIVRIQDLAEAEKRRLIEETFQKINHLIDEAYLLDQEQKKLQAEKMAQEMLDKQAAISYDTARAREQLIAQEREREESRAKLLDPLSFI
jgi:hypothetical protein